MKNILVPISFSESSKQALQYACSIAKQYGSTLSLLHCYPVQKYNRIYEFGKDDYDQGIKKMLLSFYKENSIGFDKLNLKLLAIPGPVSEYVEKNGHHFQLLIMTRKTEFHNQTNQWFHDKIFYITVKSNCPVLLLSNQSNDVSYGGIKNIWHIQRMENELEIIKVKFNKLGIKSSLVVSKSIQQKSFTSLFWQKIVAFSKTHNTALLSEIAVAFKSENIDLLVLINHKKGLFEQFLKDDVFQIISQFAIPILVLQSPPD
jgi:hypothetical protein